MAKPSSAKTTTAADAADTLRATAAFPVRRMDYSFDDVPRYWCDNEPSLTHYFTGLSLLFPEGESYFVRSVRALRGRIADAQLDKDIGAFIGQEAMHSKEHQAFHVSARRFGLNPDSLEAFTGKVLKLIERVSSKKTNLLMTVGLEHYTAVKVVSMMETVNELMVDDTLRNLWLWHSVEETEHKAVAYDLYVHLYGSGARSYLHRVAVFTFALVLIMNLSMIYTGILMARDRRLFNLRGWRRLGALAIQEYPAMFRKFGHFYKPSFHPNDADDAELVAATKARIGVA